MLKTDLSPFLGEVLRKHRKAAKITQEALSELAGVEVRTLRRVEIEGQNLSVNFADSIAHGLGLSLSTLMKEAEDLRQARKKGK